MAKQPETFEQRHAKALDIAHADFRKRLISRTRDDFGVQEDDLMGSTEVYTVAMGYWDAKDDPELESAYRWIRAIRKAWQSEVREKGERLVLADALDRAIRESTIAIGERCGTFRVELSSTVVTVRMPGPPPKLKRVA